VLAVAGDILGELEQKRVRGGFDVVADQGADFGAQVDPAGLFGSRGEAELESGEVAGAPVVQRPVVPPGVEADEVEGDGGVDVFEVGLGKASVAGPAAAGDREGLPDRSLDSGP
jgi:hypothetical protein